MSNTLLTPTMITREALRILHQKLNFIGNINRQYDDRFAQEGAKIGTALNIRLPVQYTVTTSSTLSVQNTVETNTTLNVTTQKHVGMRFTAVELTMQLDDFSKRIIEPAMAALASSMEADALNMIKDVYQSVNNIGSPIGFRQVLLGRKRLEDSLTPSDGRRIALLNTQDNVDLVDAVKGLFQSSAQIGEQYREGMMGKTSGFSFYENTLVPTFTTGTSAAATGYTVNGASQTGATIVVAAGANTFKAGDIITFVGCNECHPETKADTGRLMQFVITADYAGGAGSIAIAPSISTSGGSQNVTASPTNGGAVAKIGGASAVYRPSLLFHPDAFTFATADLVMPKGVDMAARVVQDGISLRLVRQYDINEDRMPCRVDVLYGYKTLRAQLAARILSN